ncbi:hypothetical protein N0V95_001806 [Ascochyta clinopodiicola]|nr:hypothetical protein N0V95_001806 [Ascochyta clinopodiicola]
MSRVNPIDVLAIKNVISRYCEALDTKDFKLLNEVFVQDVSADYPFNSDLQGVEAVARAIHDRYIDDMVLQESSSDDCEGVPGASGIWRIKKRKVAFTQRIGDEKIIIQTLAAGDPWTQTEYEEDPESQYDPNDRICCVYIHNFFSNGTSLVYYIGGTRNVEMFLGGMHGMQAFNGPLLFAVSPSSLSYIVESINFSATPGNRTERLAKDRTPFGRNKWRYIYETGRLAWSKADVHMEKLRQLRGMLSDNEDFDTIRLNDERINIDLKGGQDEGEASVTGSGSTPQDTEPTMSAKKRGKMKATEEQVEYPDTKVEAELPRNSGMFNIRLGGSVSKNDTPLSRRARGHTAVQETDTESEEDRTNLEAFQKANQLNTMDEAWASLKDSVRRDISHGVKLNAIMSDLADQVTSLERCEEQLAQTKATASSSSGSSKIIGELAKSERHIAADRLRLVQSTANVSAHAWKEHHTLKITGRLRSLQEEEANKDQIKNFLMDLLLSEIRDKSSERVHDVLHTEEIQAVINLVDNVELQREYFQTIQGMDGIDSGLGDLGNILHIDNQKHVSDFVAILFRYAHAVQVRGMTEIADREEVSRLGLSDHQEQLVANIMETINQNRVVAVDLLCKSWWNAEAAITRWYESEAPVDPISIISSPTSTVSKSDPSLFGSSSPAKRQYETEAGPSESRKKRRITSPNQQRLESPEEDLSAAQARLHRIIAEENAADFEVEKSQQGTDNNKNPQRNSEGLKPTVQEKSPVGFQGYGLEALKNLVAAEENPQRGGSKDKEISTSSVEPDPKSSTANQSSNILPAKRKRYDMRDRGAKIDYNDMSKTADISIEDELAAAKLPKKMRQQVSGVGDKGKKPDELEKRQSPTLPTNEPRSPDLLQNSANLWPENTSLAPSKSPPEVPSLRREPRAEPRDAPDLPLALQTSRPASPLLPEISAPLQSPPKSPPAQSKPSGHTYEGVPYSAAPYTFPSSPALRPSSGPSLASTRDLSSLPESSPPPTTHPQSAVLGHYGAKMNDPLFQDNPASSPPPPEGAQIVAPGTEKVGNWRKDSVQRMSIASATALAQNLLDAEKTAKTASEVQPGINEEAGRRVRFADDEQIVVLDDAGDDRTQNMVDEGVGEADCPEEWNEDV